jgi:hypothetical protein
MFNKNASNSFIGSVLNMSADIYSQQNVQDLNTGAIVRSWVYLKTIQCKIEPVKMKGASTKSDNKSFSQGSDLNYDEKVQLKMYCFELLSKRWRVENIRTSENRPIFIEIDKINTPDTKFEVTASHAIMDPFGKIAYYEAVLLRNELQDDSQA